MATMVPPQKGVEYIFYVCLVSQADTKLLQSNPTLASGDVTVTTDGNAFTNLDTLPDVDPDAGYAVKVTVSTTEMNGDNILIVFHDVASSEWCDLSINIQTAAQSLDTTDSAVDAIPTTAMRGTDNAYTGTPPTVDEIADQVWDELQSGHITASTFGKFLDTEVSGVGGGTAAAVADAVWDELLSGHVVAGSASKILQLVHQIEKGRWKIENNQLKIYDSDDTTVLYTFDLTNAAGMPSSYRVYERVEA